MSAPVIEQLYVPVLATAAIADNHVLTVTVADDQQALDAIARLLAPVSGGRRLLPTNRLVGPPSR